MTGEPSRPPGPGAIGDTLDARNKFQEAAAQMALQEVSTPAAIARFQGEDATDPAATARATTTLPEAP